MVFEYAYLSASESGPAPKNGSITLGPNQIERIRFPDVQALHNVQILEARNSYRILVGGVYSFLCTSGPRTVDANSYVVDLVRNSAVVVAKFGRAQAPPASGDALALYQGKFFVAESILELQAGDVIYLQQGNASSSSAVGGVKLTPPESAVNKTITIIRIF